MKKEKITETFAGLKADNAFKKSFSNIRYLKDLISSYYDYVGEYKDIEIVGHSTQKHLMASYKKGKEMYCDICAILKSRDRIVIEMYSGNFGLQEYIKTKAYLDRVFSDQFKKSNKYKSAGKVTVLCFMKGNFALENPDFINKYSYANKNTLKFVINDYEELVLIRVDKLATKSYNESERFIKWCRIINANSIEELIALSKEDKVMYEATQEIINYLISEEAARIDDAYNYDIREARDEGREEKKLEVAKNMLSMKKYSDDEILNISGITVDDLDKLKNMFVIRG